MSQFICTRKLVLCFLTHLQSFTASVKVTSKCWHRSNFRKTMYCGYEQSARPKTKNIFLVQTSKLAELFEGLNSSLAQSLGELCSC